MNWFFNMLTSSIGRKVVMALTGLFLILFLTVHLAGNLQLLNNDAGESFNTYAEFMANNPLIKTVSLGNFAFILLHVFTSIILTRKNKAARPISYQSYDQKESSAWASRNMGILGTLLLIFLVIHLKNFWYVAKFGAIEMVSYNGAAEVKDLFSVVSASFAEPLYVGLYVFCMVALAFHLSHGFKSAFQSLGLNHKKYSPLIGKLGLAFSIIVPAMFAAIPIMMYLNAQ